MVKKQKQNDSKIRNLLHRKNALQVIIIVLLIIIILLLLAMGFKWWPWNKEDTKLGTAFYTVAQMDKAETVSEADTSGSGSTGGNNSGANGSNGAAGTNGTNGTNTTTPAPVAAPSRLIDFAGGINTGNTKQSVSGSSNGLNESCILNASATSVGKQEVCTYTEGDKVVTVTYLNDRVVSASRTGF